MTQQNKQLVGLGGGGKIRLSAEPAGKSPKINVVHAVLNDVGYVKNDPTTKLLMVSHGLRDEMVTVCSDISKTQSTINGW